MMDVEARGLDLLGMITFKVTVLFLPPSSILRYLNSFRISFLFSFLVSGGFSVRGH